MLTKTLNVPSSMVAQRMQSSELVLWALVTFGRQMVDVLVERFSAQLEEGQVMPFATELELFKKELTRLRDELLAAERHVRTQRLRETRSRKRRDDVIKDVNAKVARLRRLFGGVYDDDQLADVGFSRRNARDPEELLEQAAFLAVRMGRKNLRLTGSQYDDFELEAPKFAKELKPWVKKLRLALTDLRKQERQTEAAQLAKDEAMGEFNRGFLWMARTVESYLRLAGLKKQAELVRPSTRRPGVTQQQPELPQAEGEQPEADGDELEAGGDEPQAEGESGSTAAVDLFETVDLTESEVS